MRSGVSYKRTIILRKYFLSPAGAWPPQTLSFSCTILYPAGYEVPRKCRRPFGRGRGATGVRHYFAVSPVERNFGTPSRRRPDTPALCAHPRTAPQALQPERLTVTAGQTRLLGVPAAPAALQRPLLRGRSQPFFRQSAPLCASRSRPSSEAAKPLEVHKNAAARCRSRQAGHPHYSPEEAKDRGSPSACFKESSKEQRFSLFFVYRGADENEIERRRPCRRHPWSREERPHPPPSLPAPPPRRASSFSETIIMTSERRTGRAPGTPGPCDGSRGSSPGLSKARKGAGLERGGGAVTATTDQRHLSSSQPLSGK